MKMKTEKHQQSSLVKTTTELDESFIDRMLVILPIGLMVMGGESSMASLSGEVHNIPV
jgi:hypothetical protein